MPHFIQSSSTEFIAEEALVGLFSRVGIPREILGDCGTQLASDSMHEVGRLLSMRQLATTPFHPISNSLIKKFNGTLKNMLKTFVKKRLR